MSAQPKPYRVLIVDDNESHAEALADGLELDGHSCTLAHSGREGVLKLSEQLFDVVLTDLVMPDLSGIEVLKRARSEQPDAVVILITGKGSERDAVEAFRDGATDYLTKPVDIAELRARLSRAVENARLRRDYVELRRQIDKRAGFEGIIGSSSPMQRLFEVLGQVAGTNVTVLILGESGTGKELVARAIHENSPRKEEHFVAVNCAALSEGLIESELFGHVKGAFTGAVAHKEGRIAYADRGTLFLDEVGDMPLATQAKLLRVIESREVQPVGGNQLQKVDIRLLAATNRDLKQMVKDGTFREDLMYRLAVVSIELPPLRERKSDIPLLIDHYVGELATSHKRSVRGITPEARSVLLRYDWPGNVRELRNALENMVLLARGEVLGVEDIPETVKGAPAGASGGGGGYELAGRSMEEVERALIAANLQLMGGNREKTAHVLGMGERTLYRKIKQYGL
ncbi:MAG: sigma-54-dependent Fis family transcriptional regulator [Planctomycetes bacterium]|nr:sigma-54-dependent Fis family transcriptional regulator [Planctomycetota bacterium]